MIVVLLFIFLLQHANASDNGNEGLNITWESQLSMVKSNTQILIRRFLPSLYKKVSEANISSECEHSLMAYGMALMQMKTWAVKMADASAKIPSGILEGTAMEFGSYKECLNIRVQKSSRNFTFGKELFRGKYCSLSFQHSLLKWSNKDSTPDFIKDLIMKIGGYIDRSLFVFGFCIPSACSKDDLQHLSSSVTDPYGIKSSVLDCSIDEPYVWPSSAIAAVGILCVLASLCVVGTTLDYLKRIEWKELNTKKEEDKSLLWKISESFSVLANSEIFFESSRDNHIGCFHGVRVLSASWIIYGHNYFIPDVMRSLTYRGIVGFFEKFGNFSSGFLENFTLSVTTFFVLSGFLLMKTTWKQLEKNNGKLSILEFLLHKFWRLSPGIAFTLVLLYTLQVMDSGPLWNPIINFYRNKCDGYWWSTLFYFNNLFSYDELCLEHTYFVSALVQLHIIGFILLFVTYRWKYCGILTGILLAITCLAITSYLVSLWNVPLPIFTQMKDLDKLEKYMTYVYIKPFFNLIPYMIGMIVAYISEKYSERKMTNKHKIFVWILSVTLALFSIYACYLPTESKTFSLFYLTMHRTTWALSIGLFIYICVSGCGGIVNTFLSSRPMHLLGQLSYLMYLTHYLVIIYKYASAKERTNFGDTEQVFSFISIFVIAMLISFVGYVTVEAPFLKLEKLAFRRQTKR